MPSNNQLPGFDAAFDRLRRSVTPDDARSFSSTSMEDVWKGAKGIEAELEARGSLRALRRIQPFLSGIEKYAKVVEVLCSGTPYLPWIWVCSASSPDFLGH